MKLVPDWKDCWKWNSMHANCAGLALIGAWNLLPAAWQNAFPPHTVMVLASIAFVLAVAGRLRDQTPKENT